MMWKNSLGTVSNASSGWRTKEKDTSAMRPWVALFSPLIAGRMDSHLKSDVTGQKV